MVQGPCCSFAQKTRSRPELSDLSRQDELVQVAQQIRVECLNKSRRSRFLLNS
jgi:hypothetical protein